MKLSDLLNHIPQEYKVGVAIKKVSYMVGKLAVALLAYGKVKTLVGDHMTPDHIQLVQDATAATTGAALEGLHDWARIKFPQTTNWL